MTSLVEIALFIPALVLFLLSLFLAIEVLGAFLPMRSIQRIKAPSLAVVVPAHNEAEGVADTVAHLKSQLQSGERLIVVADNCDDGTADAARAAGAEVMERQDPTRRGKGYALQHAIDALREAPPHIIVFIDADCRAGDGAIAAIAGAAAASGRPAQALYLMKAPEGAPLSRRVSEFAWLFLNRVRMSGLFTLFDVCRLTGSGMAIPYALVKDLRLASDEIVEDLSLGLDLCTKGAPPILCADAIITSVYPHTDDAAVKQRARWEHGSLRLSMRRTPPLLALSFARRDVRLAAAALDLAVPPLTLFLAILTSAVLLAALLLPSGADAPFDVLRPALGIALCAIVAGWFAFGQAALPLSALGGIWLYLRDKLKVYGAKARSTTDKWTRTERGDGPS